MSPCGLVIMAPNHGGCTAIVNVCAIVGGSSLYMVCKSSGEFHSQLARRWNTSFFDSFAIPTKGIPKLIDTSKKRQSDRFQYKMGGSYLCVPPKFTQQEVVRMCLNNFQHDLFTTLMAQTFKGLNDLCTRSVTWNSIWASVKSMPKGLVNPGIQ